MPVKRLFIALVLSLWTFAVYAAADSRVGYGLSFRSHSSNPEDRTGLCLDPDSRFSFKDGMTLEFDISFDDEDLSYGYVFRIVSGNTSVDMISNIRADRLSIVCIDRHQSVGGADFDGDLHLEEGRWYHVRLSVSELFTLKDGVVRGGIECDVDGVSRHIPLEILNLKDVRIMFGKNDDQMFFTTDVPPVTIRDIRLYDGSRLCCWWPLAKHTGDNEYDRESGLRAEAKNGIWKMDEHYEWHPVLSMEMTSQPMVAYDMETSRIFISCEDSLFVSDLDDGGLLSMVRTEGTPVRGAVNQLVYDSSGDRLLSYSMHSGRMAVYDFAEAEWHSSFDEVWPPLTGHGKYYDADSSRLYLFGGYGNHHYYAEFAEIDTRTGERTVIDLSASVTPRYFGSFCRNAEGDFIVIGGFGSRSGMQEESPMFLNDILKIDSRTGEATRLGRFRSNTGPVLFSSSMVFDEKNRSLYALAFNSMRFNTTLSLVSLSPEADTLRHYSEPIEFQYHDIDSYSELVFSQDSSFLYAIVANARQNGKNRVDVWSLAYPPVSAEDIRQPVPAPDNKAGIWIVVAMIVLAAGVSVSVVIMRRRSRYVPEAEVPRSHNASSDGLREPETRPLPEQETAPVQESGPATETDTGSGYVISLLGGFKVMGKDGSDISSKFTPKLRSLFVWLLLRTGGLPENTVLTDELTEVFWFGLEKSAATNNRNVNFNKLRLIFNDIGDIRIIMKRNIVSFIVGDGISCDYLDAVALLESMRDSARIDLDTLDRALRLCARGALLSGFESDWLDSYKAAYSELIVSVMMKSTESPAVSSDNNLSVRIADCILRVDALDEFALRLKCRVLNSNGHKGLARDTYDKWRSDYRRAMAADPQLSFEDVIK